MSSFGSGFASGLNNGMAMGKMLMDTYNENKLKRDVEAASTADQEELPVLTEHQKATADYVRDTNNGYEVQDTTGGGLRFRTAGSDNSWQDLTPGTKQYQLGDKVQDTQFSKDQVDAYRANKQAEVLAKYGDVKGAYGLRAAAREDRLASSMETIRNDHITALEDVASGNLQKYVPMLLEAYNNAPSGSKHDDKHTGVYDPERNVVAFANKRGEIVNTIPVNAQSVTAGLKELYQQKLSALDPSFSLNKDKLGLESRKLDITDKHYSEIADIERRKLGLMAGGGAGGSSSFKAMEQKAGALSMAYRKADPNLSQAEADKRAWQVMTRDTVGLKGDGEAQVEFDDGNGNKIKGTASQVHNARMKNDGAYRAGEGTDLKMTPQTSNQTGRGAANTAPVKPMNDVGFNQAAYDNYLSYAKRGDPQAKAVLAGWLNSNELSVGQRKEAERYSR